MYRSTGIARYSPKAARESFTKVSSKWWMILDTCQGLADYYRYWWNQNNKAIGPKLAKCGWTSHITIIRDEEPKHKELWAKYTGEEIEFTYMPVVEGNGNYFWINVSCDRALEIREELGLPQQLVYPLHISIGKAI